MVERICDNCMSRVPAGIERCPKCGIRFENTNPGGALPSGWVLDGRYTVGRYMEIDGEGVMYSAIDGNTLQRVTIKEYMPVTLCATRDETGSIVPKPGNDVLFKTTRDDYRDMYMTLVRMGQTEGLVQVLDVFEENNTAYTVLDKVEGPTLAEYLSKGGDPLETKRAMALMMPVMRGVETMHAARLIHRGISPENIVLESGGTAKLAGYGTLALRQQGSELKPKLYPGYSAPEQYAASEFEDYSTDVYALAAVLYRLVTGEVPEPADERKMQDGLEPARQLNKEVPNFVSAALGRALRLSNEERIRSVGDFRLALSGEGGREKKSSGGGLTKQQLLIGGIALGAVVLIIIIVLIVNALSGDKDDTSTTSMPSTSIASGIENPVPDLTGQTWVFVENRYGTDFNLVKREEYSSNVSEGYVISQNPPAGSEYEGAIEVVVSMGEDPDTNNKDMPNFSASGTSMEAARTQLQNLGVPAANISAVEEENDGSYTKGQVIRTDPTAGVSFNVKEAKVTIYYAAEAEVTVPDLSNLSQGDVSLGLQEVGLVMGDVVQVSNDGSYIPGRSVSTNPAAGTKVAPGTRVSVNIAKGVNLPNVLYKTEEEAKKALYAIESSSGLSITINVQYSPNNLPSGQVYDMTPTSDAEVTGSVTVTLYVSQGPD